LQTEPPEKTMSNQAIAAHILAKCARRLTGREHALCIAIAEGIHSHEQIASSDWNWFESLKTQFAADLADMAEPVKIEANPQDPVFL
jgi:hypothetical protein